MNREWVEKARQSALLSGLRGQVPSHHTFTRWNEWYSEVFTSEIIPEHSCASIFCAGFILCSSSNISLTDLQGPWYFIPVFQPSAELWVSISSVCHSPMPRPCRAPGPRRSLQHHSVLHLPEDRAAGQQQQRHCGQCTDPAHSKWRAVCGSHPGVVRFLFHSDCLYHSVLCNQVKI